MLEKFKLLFKQKETSHKKEESLIKRRVEPQFHEPIKTPLRELPEKKEEDIVEFDLHEIVSNRNKVKFRIMHHSPLILCEDLNGNIQKDLKDNLQDYKVIEINTVEKPGPFNVFDGMTKDDVKYYEKVLAPKMDPSVLTDLSKVLLHSILLGMIESQDLSWKKFTALMSSIKREKPEYVSTAIDDEIVQAFESFKYLTKNPDKILNEFDKYKNREFWDATQGITQDNDFVIVFFRNYSDPTLNKLLEYRLTKI